MTDPGYSREKADRLIERHESRARELEAEAEGMEAGRTFRSDAGDEDIGSLRKEARRHRDRADNMRQLKKHWGDD